MKLIGTANVGTDGTWSFTVPDSITEKAGKHTFTAISTDGDVWGATSQQFSVTLPAGGQVPNPPVVDSFTDNVGPVTGPITAGTTTDDAKPTMSGTGTAGDIIKLYDGDKVIGSTTVDPTGKWTVQPKDDLSNGAHDVHVTESNATGESGPTLHKITATETTAGGESGKSDPVNFTVLTHIDKPSITAVTDDSGSTNVPIGHGTTTDTTPVISGGGVAGAVIKLYDNGGQTSIGSTTVNDNGTWSFKPASPLNVGQHDITATQTNTAVGLTSGSSDDWTFSVVPAVKVPNPPIIHDVTDAVGTVTGPIANNGTTDDPKPTIHGTGDAGSKITVYDGTTNLGTATVDNNGNWSFQPGTALADGLHKITATETTAGGESGKSDPVNFTVLTHIDKPRPRWSIPMAAVRFLTLIRLRKV